MTKTKTAAVIEPQVLAFDGFDDFEGNVIQSGGFPYCQIVNPPNISAAKIVQQDEPYGLFLTKEQAEAAEFTPDENWVERSVFFGDEDTATDGYLCRKVRLLVIRQSQMEAQEQTERGWRFLGLTYEKGKLTKHGETVKASKGTENSPYRNVVRYLFAFVNDKNELLHSRPIALTGRGGFGGAFGNELKEFYRQVDQTYIKAARAAGKSVKGSGLDMQGHALCILDAELGFTKPDGKAPYVCITKRLTPSLDQVGVSKTIDRKSSKDESRKIELVGAELWSILQRKTSELGKQILAWFEEHESFSAPNMGRDGQEAEAIDPNYYGQGIASDINFNTDGSISVVFKTETEQQLLKVQGDIMTAFEDAFNQTQEFRVVAESGWIKSFEPIFPAVDDDEDF